MRKRVCIILGAVAIVAIALGLTLSANREPRYQGRLLWNWIRNGSDAAHTNTSGARAAVMACGTNAIPYYLKLLEKRPRSSVKDKVLDFLDRHDLPEFGLSREDETIPNENIGALGLAILGSEARTAAPALLRLIRDTNEYVADRAGYALARTGEGAMIISNLISDPQSRISGRATTVAGYYGVVGKPPLIPRSHAEIENSARILLPALIPRIHVPAPIPHSIMTGGGGPSAAGAAFRMRGGGLSEAEAAFNQFAKLREIVVPILIGELENTNRNWMERSKYIRLIARFGPKGKPAVPVLLAVLDDPSRFVREAAGAALMQIDDVAGTEVVTRFTALMLDPNLDTEDRLGLIITLGSFREKAIAAVPALVELTRSRDERVSGYSRSSLLAIEPEAAARAGVK